MIGILMGLLCGPFYEHSNKKCKDSLEPDTYTRDYREAMGVDKKPTAFGYIPVESLWILSIIKGIQYCFKWSYNVSSMPGSIYHAC